MASSVPRNPVISGVGVTSAIGQGKERFSSALLEGRHRFATMQRPGRSFDADGREVTFLGAEIDDLQMPQRVPARLLRSASWTAQVAAATLAEAWDEADLDAVAPERIGLIVGGSNLQQREQLLTQQKFASRIAYVRPSYAATFFDNDICGLCCEAFGIRGPSYSLGAASASGQAALIQACHAVLSGQVDVCIALGALMDLSYWECQALRSAGAMGSDRFASEPERACRPCDRASDGFIFGEACSALVVESAERALARGVRPYAELDGWCSVGDAARGTAPSYEGEMQAIRGALQAAKAQASDIDYVNLHGTGSKLGDETELRAVRDAGLAHARLNATKSLTGHGLTAAGAVEVAAILMQMRAGRLHPTLNLDDPVDPALNWVRAKAVDHRIERALTLSMGFGGTNTAMCLRQFQ